MKKMTKISAVIASFLVVGVANAVAPGAYVGAGAGASILRTPSVTKQAGVSTSQKRGGLGGRVFAGYNFNTNFGLEAALATYANSTNKSSASGMSVSQKDYMNALSLVGKGYLPLGESGVNAYVLGGVAEARNHIRTETTGIPASAVPTGTKTTTALRPTFGAGLSYDLPNNMTTNLEVSRIQGKGNMKTSASAMPNADMVSLNLGYNFG